MHKCHQPYFQLPLILMFGFTITKPKKEKLLVGIFPEFVGRALLHFSFSLRDILNRTIFLFISIFFSFGRMWFSSNSCAYDLQIPNWIKSLHALNTIVHATLGFGRPSKMPAFGHCIGPYLGLT